MTSARSQARLNLQIATVNIGLKRRLLTLDCTPVQEAPFQFGIAGHPANASIDDAGFDEVRFRTTVSPKDEGRRSIASIGSGGWRWGGSPITASGS
jgi:hypothetical protein